MANSIDINAPHHNYTSSITKSIWDTEILIVLQDTHLSFLIRWIRVMINKYFNNNICIYICLINGNNTWQY